MKTMNFYSFGQLLVGSLVGVVRSYAPQNRFESIAHWSQRLFEVKINSRSLLHRQKWTVIYYVKKFVKESQ